jgi:hypothetical protein
MSTSTLRTPTGLSAIADWCGAHPQQVIDAGKSTAPRVVVSGRLASGKDTVAVAVMDALGQKNSVQVSFATALRREVAELLSIVSAAVDVDTAVDSVADFANITLEDARPTVELLRDALQNNPNITPYTRTREMRLALQEWGTGVRRRYDNDYWVKRGAADVIAGLASGNAVHITDARFINEVEIARSLGFWAVRLQVDLETRAARLYARDGLIIDPASENHPSEVELETYNGFDQWVSNNGALENTVADIIAKIR